MRRTRQSTHINREGEPTQRLALGLARTRLPRAATRLARATGRRRPLAWSLRESAGVRVLYAVARVSCCVSPMQPVTSLSRIRMNAGRHKISGDTARVWRAAALRALWRVYMCI